MPASGHRGSPALRMGTGLDLLLRICDWPRVRRDKHSAVRPAAGAAPRRCQVVRISGADDPTPVSGTAHVRFAFTVCDSPEAPAHRSYRVRAALRTPGRRSPSVSSSGLNCLRPRLPTGVRERTACTSRVDGARHSD